MEKIEGLVCSLCDKTCSNIQELCDHSETHNIETHIEETVVSKSKQEHDVKTNFLTDNDTLTASSANSTLDYKKYVYGTFFASDHAAYACSAKKKIDLDCHFCGKLYTEQIFLLMHEKAHQTGCFECHICNKIFSSEAELTQHYKIHMTTKSYVCEICGKRCFGSGQLRFHYLHHLRKMVCGLCRRTFDSFEKLKEHCFSKSCGSSYICHGCRSEYVMYSLLVDHLQTCPHAKHFICEICDVDCMSANGLKRHMYSHEINENHCLPNTKFECRTYSKKRKENADSVMGFKSEATDGSGHFMCRECNILFQSAEILERHTTGHSNDQLWILSNIKDKSSVPSEQIIKDCIKQEIKEERP